MTHTRAIIRSTGAYLPEKIMTNDDLAKIVDTSDEWISQRSGIKSRHIAADDQPTSDLALRAAKQALENAGLTAADIDGVIVATTTPDSTFPSVAVRVQSALGVPPGIAFDVQAVCSGFIYALSVANNFITAHQAKRILVIGAEKMSSIVDWEDRTTCVLFADGAGAVMLESSSDADADDQGIMSAHLHANGDHADILYTNGGPSTTGESGHIVMHGREVFKHAVTLMSDVVEEALSHNGLSASDVDFLVPHQANLRIIEGTAKKLKMSLDQVVITVDRHGNTSAASIPLALHEAVSDGRIQRGHTVLMEALGAGLTWGAVIAKF
ncbi:MAG: 3-oxoacyl-ACP synthase [Alphaproteobacteria bacterium]|nr:3-oxoacyl-ACP synthase [Alphaproteobacteria bacterium]HCQ71336.1 3-oxoacyl-ACP synthase [Rhodospirillaceae bacterium]|tara:strand:- start:43688 stop:44662 length:975 start_codon:yes stop_codon:yes gene_type:complete